MGACLCLDLVSGHPWDRSQWALTPGRPGKTASFQFLPPCDAAPAMWPRPRTHRIPVTLCLVLAHVPLSQEVRGSLPVCTDTPPVQLYPPRFPDINSRSGSVRPLPTHPPAFTNFPLSLLPHSRTRLLISSPPSPMTFLEATRLFLTPSHSPPSSHGRPDVVERKGPIRNDRRTPTLWKPHHLSKT